MKKLRSLLKVLVSFTLMMAVVYLVACTYLWARQARFIFSPEAVIKETPADYDLPFEDVYIAVKDEDDPGARIHGWWIPAMGSSEKVLLYLHGSGLNIGANASHARRFRNLGFSVLLISYRGYGKSSGPFPSESQVYADAEASWEYLVHHKKIAPEAITIYGHSLGGAVAIELAVRHPDAAGLIVEATFTSVADIARLDTLYRLFPIDLIVNHRFESLSKIGRLKVPVLFIHGTQDELVPKEMSRLMYEQASTSKQLRFIEGGGHNNSAAVGGEAYLQAVRDFMDSIVMSQN